MLNSYLELHLTNICVNLRYLFNVNQAHSMNYSGASDGPAGNGMTDTENYTSDSILQKLNHFIFNNYKIYFIIAFSFKLKDQVNWWSYFKFKLKLFKQLEEF